MLLNIERNHRENKSNLELSKDWMNTATYLLDLSFIIKVLIVLSSLCHDGESRDTTTTTMTDI